MNKPKFNYILNDLAFSNLQTKCLYTECTGQDIVEFENQLKLKEQELQRKDNEINDLKSSIADYQEAVGDYQDEIVRKDNIINKIKKALKDHKEIKNKTNTKEYYIEVDEVLDYIKELEERK